MPRLVVAVDGGNSKTDVALVTGGGAVLSWVRGPGGALGPERTAALVARLARTAARGAGVSLDGAHAACCLAGVDLPEQRAAMRAAVAAEGTLASAEVVNDAWALLRLGASGAAVGIVCGAGLKCVARAGGERVEFPSMGWQSGDLSGGGDFLAREAVRAAVRAEDGRGPHTRLHDVVRAGLAVPAASAVAGRLLDGTLAEERLGVLAPAVLACAAQGDLVATSIVRTLAVEIAILARTARRRLTGSGWTLVLGGGLFTDPEGRLLAAVRAAEPELTARFTVAVPDAPPVAGAALLALDHVRAGAITGEVRRAFRAATPRSAGGEGQ